MSIMFFAKSTCGFYSHEIHGETIPADAVEISAADHAALLEAQSHGQRIEADASGKPVAVDPPPPTAAEVWNRIKAQRDSALLGGVKVGAKWYHTDDASRIKYLALLKMAEQALAAGASGATVLQYGGVDIQWKTLDNTFAAMTVQLAQEVFAAVAGLDFTAFAVAEQHRMAMEAAADPAAYDFTTGWPASIA